MSAKDKKLVDLDLVFEGKKLILPSGTEDKIDQVIGVLERKLKELQTVVTVNEVVDAYPFDGALAFADAMKEIYGVVLTKPGSFFRAPPTIMNVSVGVNEQRPVIWGTFELPNVEGELLTGIAEHEGRRCFVIRGSVRKKHMPEILALANRTREIVKNNSIYRGKAIRLTVDRDGNIDHERGPQFLDLANVNTEELTFSAETAVQVETSLWTPIKKTEQVRKHKIPLKRGVLLKGPFGTGKTLTAFATAQLCEKHGWTFVMVSDVAGLRETIEFARRFQPAVVFAEDIDRAVEGQERTSQIDSVLNTIDGIESKNSELMVVLTTNNAEEINRAMIRPGRLDAIIEVSAPDAAAVKKLVRIYARGMLDQNDPLELSSEALAGQIPAVIREAVERAKLYALSENDDGQVTDTALFNAVQGMKEHLNLLYKKDDEPSNAELLEKSIGKAVAKAVGLDESIAEEVEETKNMVVRNAEDMRRRLSKTQEIAIAARNAAATAAETAENIENGVGVVNNKVTKIANRLDA